MNNLRRLYVLVTLLGALGVLGAPVDVNGDSGYLDVANALSVRRVSGPRPLPKPSTPKPPAVSPPPVPPKPVSPPKATAPPPPPPSKPATPPAAPSPPPNVTPAAIPPAASPVASGGGGLLDNGLGKVATALGIINDLGGATSVIGNLIPQAPASTPTAIPSPDGVESVDGASTDSVVEPTDAASDSASVSPTDSVSPDAAPTDSPIVATPTDSVFATASV
ncbi:hypothetical protein BD410DRAFT_841539 [Rickenella mellea]|uniref:WH2 domain-containing protein n=1 Tax=Rickenella mellea TaxID=50990 RepID=A0A4Y7PXR8_9AGAM|nr:hypothetical protein BD410DRAFT_841539 [Rickenella mellea]